MVVDKTLTPTLAPAIDVSFYALDPKLYKVHQVSSAGLVLLKPFTFRELLKTHLAY